MDGPFFSTMPFPADRLNSLTHVRYTPHRRWIDTMTGPLSYEIATGLKPESRARHRLLDARRFLPYRHEARHATSIDDVKSVLLKNERDDGRPILFQRQREGSRLTSIMGGTIDNIYALLLLLKQEGPEWNGAQNRFGQDRFVQYRFGLGREAAGERA